MATASASESREAAADETRTAAQRWEWLALGASALAGALLLGWAIVSTLRDDRTGHAIFTTTEGPLLVSLKHVDTGRTVKLTAPHSDPIDVLAGDHDAEAKREGRFSARYRIFVEGKTQSISRLAPPNPAIWSVPKAETIQIVRGPDLRLVILGTDEKRVAELDPATGRERWSRKVVLTASPAIANPGGLDAPLPPGRWGALDRVRSPLGFQPKRCVATPDINGDGEHDIVLASPDDGALLALSGADGQVLWHSPLTDVLKAGIDGLAPSSGPPIPIAVDAAPDCDCDGDGRPDLLAMFAIALDETRSLHVLAAIRGDSGSLIWKVPAPSARIPDAVRIPPDLRWFSARQARFAPGPAPFGEEFETVAARGYDPWIVLPPQDNVRYSARIGSYPVLIARIGASRAAVWTEFDRFLVADLATGRSLSPPLTLRDTLMTPPRLARSGPRGPDRVLIAQKETDGWSKPVLWATRFQLRDPTSAAPIWSVSVAGWTTGRETATATATAGVLSPSLPLIEDLNGDGSDEVILPASGTLMTKASFGRAPMGALQVWRSDSSEPLWPRPVPIRCADQRIPHVLVGSDIDGDGWRDLFAATRYLGPGYDRPAIHIDALSGADGRILWKLMIPSPGRGSHPTIPEILRFAIAESQGPGEVAALAIAHSEASSERINSGRSTFLIDLRNGFVFSEAPGLEFIASDEDVLLCLRRDPSRSSVPSPSGASSLGWAEDDRRILEAFLMPPRDGWGYAAARLRPVGDVNGDGVPDLLGRHGEWLDRVLCVDGRSGRSLWSRVEADVGRSTSSRVDPRLNGSETTWNGGPSIHPLMIRGLRTRVWLTIGDADGDGLTDLTRISPSMPGRQPSSWIELVRGRDGSTIAVGMGVGLLKGEGDSREAAVLTPEVKARAKLGISEEGVVVKSGDLLIQHNSATGRLRAVRIADGADQWEAALSQYQSRSAPLVKFDASNGPQVVHAGLKPSSATGKNPTIELTAFDANTGKASWFWWSEADPESRGREIRDPALPPPVQVRAPRSGAQGRLGVWVRSPDGTPELLVIEPNSSQLADIISRVALTSAPKREEPTDSSRLPIKRNPSDHDALRFLIADANGDGLNDVIFMTRGFAVASTLDGTELWRTPIRTDNLNADLRIKPDGLLLVGGAQGSVPVAWELDPASGRVLERIVGPHSSLADGGAVSAVEREQGWFEGLAARPRSAVLEERAARTNQGADPRELRLFPWAIDPYSWFPPPSEAIMRAGAPSLLASVLLGAILPLGASRLLRRRVSLAHFLLIPPIVGAVVVATFGIPLDPASFRDHPFERISHGLAMAALGVPLAPVIISAARGRPRAGLIVIGAVIATYAAATFGWLLLDASRHGNYHYVNSGWTQPLFYALAINGCGLVLIWAILRIHHVAHRLVRIVKARRLSV